MPKVIVGMSGGIDSSVTAYLLKKEGYDVEGVSFILWETERQADTYCSFRLTEEAAKIASHIGIPHNVLDLRNDFLEKVIKPFVGAYIKGITPNPCILCNKFIKFPFLLKEAEKRDADFIATGHYARIEREQDARCKMQVLNNPPIPSLEKGDKGGFVNSYFLLKKGIDPKKDQSYVLYVLTQKELKRLILPLGNYKKDEVRKLANEFNLPAVRRAESQEICFIEDRNYFRFVKGFAPVEMKPGPIVDMNGKIMGTHKGICRYTIGQRKRLGVSYSEPLYVVKIDALKNKIYVGAREAAKRREFFVEDLNWVKPIWGDGEAMPRPYRASVKVRSTMQDEPATIYIKTNPPSPPFTKGGREGLSGGSVHVVFDEPQWAPAPGQSAVFYDGDVVIGGGVINSDHLQN
ncbi:MAG: tRNA 2-thiouridine(34) synthase MnmA [Nitrospirota bacterium]